MQSPTPVSARRNTQVRSRSPTGEASGATPASTVMPAASDAMPPMMPSTVRRTWASRVQSGARAAVMAVRIVSDTPRKASRMAVR